MKRISSNTLKLIACIAMLIDHIAVFFEPNLSSECYLIARIIGRIAMPIFVYTLVQGYLYTKDFKRYIKRLGVLAVMTQIIIFLMSYLMHQYTAMPVVSLYSFLNIIFSFPLCLIVLRAIDFRKKYIQKYNKCINVLLRVMTVIVVLFLYSILEIDYGIFVPSIGVIYFMFECLKQKRKNKIELLIYSFIELLISFVIMLFYHRLELFSFFSIPILLLYSGNRGNVSKNYYKFFYYFYPLHFLLLYSIAILIGRI